MCSARELEQLRPGEKLGQWVAAGKVPEQMPEARTCRKELQHVSATRLIIAHWVLSCLTQAFFIFWWWVGVTVCLLYDLVSKE